jgi:hypothetical protein
LPFDSRKTRSLVAATGGAALVALLAAGPARADDNMWNNMLGWVGLGHKQQQSVDDGTIDYTPRPALVVPPKMDLPPPQASISKPADWPHDPDARARAAAEADSRRPAPSSDSSSDDATGGFVADADKSKSDSGESEACTNEPGKPICFYGPSSLINFTKGWGNIFTPHKEDTSKLRVGIEPPRQYLSEPPPGYQMPKIKGEDDSDADSSDTADVSKYDAVDVGAPRHHHHSSTDSSASN